MTISVLMSGQIWMQLYINVPLESNFHFIWEAIYNFVENSLLLNHVKYSLFY